MKLRRFFKVFVATSLGVLALVTIFALCFFFLLYLSYSGWKKQFDIREFDQSLKNVETQQLEERSLKLSDKFIKFSDSSEEVDFITLTDEEALILVTYQLSKNLPEGVSIHSSYLESNEGRWEFYFEPEYRGALLPVVYISVQKDEIESAQVYVDQVMIGQLDAEIIFGKGVVDKINESYINALIDSNENDLGYRELKNIELKDNEVIIKGSVK